MTARLRTFIFLPIIFVLTAGGIYYARSALDTYPPEINLTGIEDQCYYAGDIACTITGKDKNTVADISIWLDDKPLINHYKINRKVFDYGFTITTSSLTPGKHTLKISAVDGSRNKNETVKEINFYIDNAPLQAAFVKADNNCRVFQGRTLHIQFQVNKELKDATIEALSKKYPCYPESDGSLIYECFFPISCEEAPNEHLLRIALSDYVGNRAVLENKFHVVMYPFKKQVLTINPDKIKEEIEQGLSERELEKDLEEASRNSISRKLWRGPFDIPLEMRGISTEYGTMRLTQDRGKYRHNAVDLLGVPRSVIWAPQNGKVVIKERYAHSGNTVVLDHGCGVLSLFFHLDSFAPLEVGDMVEKGNPIGKLGKTGYASGYHLHWEIRIGDNMQVDPMEWTKLGF